MPSFEIFGTEEEKLRMTAILARLSKSPENRQILQNAADDGYRLCFLPLDGMVGVCNSDKKVILLNPRSSEDKLMGALLHEATHAYQKTASLEKKYPKQDARSSMLITRVMEADAEQAAFLGLKRLAKQGDAEPFNNYADIKPHLMEAYEEARQNNKAQTLQEESMAVFDGWFDRPLSKQFYEDWHIVGSLGYLKQEGRLSEVEQPEQAVPLGEIAETICRLPDGKPYFSKDPAILTTRKYSDITPEVKNFYAEVEEERVRLFGGKEDDSLKGLPLRPRQWAHWGQPPHAALEDAIEGQGKVSEAIDMLSKMIDEKLRKGHRS